MKLTENQIQELYKFTRKHYVEHYDVQTELVDHLANDIEQICVAHPHLSFIEARDKSFKKFGVFGFMEVVEEKQKQLSKKYFKILWRFVKEWFQLPKIILTILIFMIFYSVFLIENWKSIMLVIFFCLAIYEILKLYQLRKKTKENFKTKGKKWMLEDMIFNTAGGLSVMLPINTINLFNLSTADSFIVTNQFTVIISSLFLTLMVIAIYVSIEIIPKKAEELLQEHYPEYNIS